MILHTAGGGEIPCFPFSSGAEAENVSNFFVKDIKVYKVEKHLIREKYHIHNFKEEYFKMQ